MADVAAWKENGDPAYMEDAACKKIDTSFFFPEDSDPEREDDIRDICAGCPVNQECLEYALANKIRFGWWGGYSEAERKKMTL